MNATKVLQDWAKDWKKVNLDEETVNLISQANFDLYYGPSGNDENYPGFTTACKQISDALDALPSTLYVDDQGCVCDSEPEECEFFYTVDRKDIEKAIVGKELVQYI